MAVGSVPCIEKPLHVGSWTKAFSRIALKTAILWESLLADDENSDNVVFGGGVPFIPLSTVY